MSGGGLLSGVATGIKLSAEAEGIAAPQVWGCEPELAADAAESFRTKELVEWPAEMTTRTLCDGLRTQSLGVLNFEHILRFVDGMVTIREEEIRAAARVILAATKMVAEPSGAVDAGGCVVSCGGAAEGAQGGGDCVRREPGAGVAGGAGGDLVVDGAGSCGIPGLRSETWGTRFAPGMWVREDRIGACLFWFKY